MKIEKCAICKKNKATLTFSDSFMSQIHGFTQRICKDCYIKLNLNMARDCIDSVLEQMETK